MIDLKVSTAKIVKIFKFSSQACPFFHTSTQKKRPAARAVGRFVFLMWYLRGSNQGHADFQSTALPLS